MTDIWDIANAMEIPESPVSHLLRWVPIFGSPYTIELCCKACHSEHDPDCWEPCCEVFELELKIMDKDAIILRLEDTLIKLLGYDL